MSEFTTFISNTLIGSILGRKSRNNPYISQPDFYLHPLLFNRQEQWQTITGNERIVYLTTPELRLVIDRLALMLANGVWKHYDKNGEVMEKSPFVHLLENPNPLQSRNEFLTQYYVQRALYGNVYIYQLMGTSLQEVPSALWNLPPERMIINRTGKIWKQTEMDDIISGYQFRLDMEGKKNEEFTTDEIIKFSISNPDDPIMGASPLHAIRMPISNIRAAYGYRNLIATKKGALGVWSSDSKDSHGSVALGDQEAEQMEKQLLRSYGIGDHQRSIIVARNAVKFTPATFPTKDLMLFEEVDAGKRAIIDLYGANDNMFSREKGSTFTNVEQGERLCYQDTIIPLAEDLANGLSKKWGLLDREETLELCYDHIPVLQEDESKKAVVDERKAKTVKTLIDSGMKLEDARKVVGWAEI